MLLIMKTEQDKVAEFFCQQHGVPTSVIFTFCSIGFIKESLSNLTHQLTLNSQMVMNATNKTVCSEGCFK